MLLRRTTADSSDSLRREAVQLVTACHLRTDSVPELRVSFDASLILPPVVLGARVVVDRALNGWTMEVHDLQAASPA